MNPKDLIALVGGALWIMGSVLIQFPDKLLDVPPAVGQVPPTREDVLRLLADHFRDGDDCLRSVKRYNVSCPLEAVVDLGLVHNIREELVRHQVSAEVALDLAARIALDEDRYEALADPRLDAVDRALADAIWDKHAH